MLGTSKTVKSVNRQGFFMEESKKELESYIGKEGIVVERYREEPCAPIVFTLQFENRAQVNFFEDELS